MMSGVFYRPRNREAESNNGASLAPRAGTEHSQRDARDRYNTIVRITALVSPFAIAARAFRISSPSTALSIPMYSAAPKRLPYPK